MAPPCRRWQLGFECGCTAGRRKRTAYHGRYGRLHQIIKTSAIYFFVEQGQTPLDVDASSEMTIMRCRGPVKQKIYYRGFDQRRYASRIKFSLPSSLDVPANFICPAASRYPRSTYLSASRTFCSTTKI